MSDLAEFILARIAEDKVSAFSEQHLRTGDPYWTSGEASAWERRQTPDRVFEECAAKRRIAEEHGPFQHERAAPGIWCRMCASPTGWPFATATGGTMYPCRTLRLLALPYAEHPDYRQEWAP